MRDEKERLKQQATKLHLLSKQLQDRARQLQTIHLLVNTRVPLLTQSSTEELCRPPFPQQRAGEVEQPSGALLAQDKQDGFSEKAAEELQAQVAADEEGSHYVSTHCPTCQQLQVKLKEARNENTRLAEENARLHRQMGLAERAPKVSGRGARFCQREKKHKQTESALQGKEEKGQQLFQELERMERSNRITSRPCQATLGADKESILLEAMRKQLAELRAFIARYSYDPYSGLNEWPELELPLVAGQYVYVFGDVDEDGWYVGELIDGTRGFVPSNLVEEVSDDYLMTPESPETSGWLQDTDDICPVFL